MSRLKNPKPSNQVVEHLENAHHSLFEKHQAVLREYVRGKHGVYALYSGDRLYYVGLASNLRNRLRHHLKDRHRGKWDRFNLRVLRPTGNRARGRLRESRDLKRYFRRRIKEAHQAELQRFFAPPELDGNGDEPRGQLAQYVKRRLPFRMMYRGKLYKAVARPDGTIRFKGKTYSSATAAARRVRPTTNGWHWWKYERSPGEWVRLGEPRRPARSKRRRGRQT